MRFPVLLALRYARASKGHFVAAGTWLSTLGVALGVALLLAVMSVTGGFRHAFRDKVLGVNAHVIVLKDIGRFSEYREAVRRAEAVPGVVAAEPFILNPMMVSHNGRTATGVLLKGVDNVKVIQVLDLTKHMIRGDLLHLRRSGLHVPEAPAPNSTIGPGFKQVLGPGGSSVRVQSATAADVCTQDLSNLPLLEAIRVRTLQDAPGCKALRAEAAKHAPAPSMPTSLVPAQGYQSALPDDDILPEGVGENPCEVPGVLPGLVVGAALSKQLAADLGDCVQVTSPLVGIGQNGQAPVAKAFRITGVFQAGFDQYDAKLVYTDLYEAQSFYDQGDSVSGIEMKISDIDASAEVSAELQRALGSDALRTLDWMELNRGLFQALQNQQVLISTAMGLLVLIAACTVVATLVMVVLERKKEIALLKALGATDGDILRVFVLQGVVMGIVGTTAGLAGGYGLCVALGRMHLPLDPKVYFITQVPVHVSPTEFFVTAMVAMHISALASVLPALHAAWGRPAAGLAGRQ